MHSVIDLNDIEVFVDTGSQQLSSPGYALLQRDQDPVLGEIALRQARLAPARTANRFWRDLSLNPVGISHPQVRHQADLVWHHIKRIHAELSLDQALFLCPSHYTEEQLSLLSGILKAQQIKPSVLVKRALAAAARDLEASVYIEVQLHQILLTPLDYHDGDRMVGETRILAGEGYASVVDVLLKAIQKRFIRETRFDPLHHASTEQQLADALPDLLGHLTRSETTLALVQARDDEYRAEIRREDMAGAIESLWGSIAAGLPDGSRILADQVLGLFPGFDSLQHDFRLLDSELLTQAARSLPLPTNLDTDSPAFLTRARLAPQTESLKAAEHLQPKPSPSADRVIPAPVPKVSEASDLATHLLCRGVALRRERMWLGVSTQGRMELMATAPGAPLARCLATSQGVEIEALADIQLNGEKLVGKRLLHIADHISAYDVPGGATAIQVVGDG